MSDSRVHDGIRYEVLNESTLREAIDCASQVFSACEPLASYLGITAEELREFADHYYPDLIEDRISWIAMDDATGQVVGVRISEDYAANRIPPIERLTPKLLPIFGILGELNDYFEKFSLLPTARYAHMFMIAVREDYLGRGIAPTMNRYFFRDIQARGYTHAVTEPTGSISQHVLRDKFGFKTLHRIPYRTWTFEHKPVFAGLSEHNCAMLMVKDLSELRLGLNGG